MRRSLPVSIYGPKHPDFEEVSEVEQAILHSLDSQTTLAEQIGLLLRKCIDDVIDTPSTRRSSYAELEKTEKTYIGTRVEIKLRALLGFPKGKLDLLIAGRNVDVKFTIGGNWMIPTEAIDEICILIAADEEREVCYFGLIKSKLAYMNPSDNKDSKKTISKAGFANINWLVVEEPYPANFWKSISSKKRNAIFAEGTGNGRLVKLFEELQNVPINRSVIEGVAQQKDYMKRLRSNGGARDELGRRRILLLSGKYDAPAIKSMGLPFCDNDEFISTKVKP